MKEALGDFIKCQIVVDTRSSLVYIGTLAEVRGGAIVLTEVDVHDCEETATPRERYIMDSKTSGIKANRDRVTVNSDWIISFSPLEAIKEFRTD